MAVSREHNNHPLVPLSAHDVRSGDLAENSVPGRWSSSLLGECLGEELEVGVMSEAQVSELILLEPGDGIMFI
jgi:hypothetical protein